MKREDESPEVALARRRVGAGAAEPKPLHVTLLTDAEPPITCIKCGHVGKVKISLPEAIADWIIEKVRPIEAERDAALARALAAEAKLGEAARLLRRIAKMGREVIQPTRIERDCIAWEDRFDARPSPAPTEPAPSELARLREFARSVFEEHSCGEECEDAEGNPVDPTECPCGGDECWRCAAAQALKPPSWAPAPTEAPAPGTEEKEPTR